MLVSQESIVTLNSKNVKHYEELGYYIPRSKDSKGRLRIPKGTQIVVKTNDLSKGSHVLVRYACDYCNTEYEISYKDYLKGHDSELGDCCHKCEGIKYKRTMKEKYGTENVMEIPGMVERVKATNLERYGYDYHMQREEYQKQYEETMLKRYGVRRALQNDKFKSKMISTWAANKTTPTSKPQLEIFKILCELYPNCCELEVPCDRCLLDCVVSKDNVKIDVEYDGKFWHQDADKDRRRDYFIQSRGYKILRIKGNTKDEIPSKEIIANAIDNLLSSKKRKEKIIM